jgi:hypothetical protein
MRIAWLDLASGVSGDMLLAALADAGAADAIKAAVASVGCDVAFDETTRGEMRCLVARVEGGERRMDPVELRGSLEHAQLSARARARSLRALEVLLAAEARVHGGGDLHLHELGTADTAADLAGTASGFEALGVSMVAAGPVPHGSLAPVTLELLRGAPVRGVPETAELVTPTGAAVLVAHDTVFGFPPAMTVDEIGVGGGARQLAAPNVCRMVVGSQDGVGGATLHTDVLLECNIDDQAPESLGHALEALFAAGVRDAWITPIVMKKSRPAFQLSVLVAPADEARALDIVFRETTTLGARRRLVEKWALEREILHVPVRGVNVRVKVGRIAGEAVTVSPEFDDCADVAARSHTPLKDVYAEAAERARRLLSGAGG